MEERKIYFKASDDSFNQTCILLISKYYRHLDNWVDLINSASKLHIESNRGNVYDASILDDADIDFFIKKYKKVTVQIHEVRGIPIYNVCYIQKGKHLLDNVDVIKFSDYKKLSETMKE